MVNLLGCSLNILNSYVPKAIISGQTTVWTPATVWMSFPMGAAANLDAKCNYDRTSLFWTHEPTGLHSDCWLVQLLSLTWVVGLWEGDELLKMYVSSLKIHSQGEPPPICALIKHGQLLTMANSRDTSFPPPAQQQTLRPAFYSWLSTWAVIYICELLIIAGAAVFSIRRWICWLMICINTCRCFISH